MKKILFLFAIVPCTLFVYAQNEEFTRNLVSNPDFINWIANTTVNEWDISVELEDQMGDKLGKFKEALLAAESDDDVNNVISEFGLDPEYADQKMAEHIVYGLYFRQQNPWLWDLPESERILLIRNAYFQGMHSDLPEWNSIKSNLLSRIITRCGTTTRITAAEIADCFWSVIVDAAKILGGITALVSAINTGSLNAAVVAVKKILKTAGRRLGWFGLAIAAIDVAICIWNANDN